MVLGSWLIVSLPNHVNICAAGQSQKKTLSLSTFMLLTKLTAISRKSSQSRELPLDLLGCVGRFLPSLAWYSEKEGQGGF